MKSFQEIHAVCEASKQITRDLIDQELIPLALERERPDKVFDERLHRFRHVLSQIPGNWELMAKMQYIVHCIFKKGGLITKFRNSSLLKRISTREREYLETVSRTPWRFCFSEIVGNPHPDFYEMEDVFSGEIFLLYSPAVSQKLTTERPLLWFNLICDNGHCCETYGPVVSFAGMDADDVYFYATEINKSILSEEDLIRDLNENPVRYMVLIYGSLYPLLVSNTDDGFVVRREMLGEVAFGHFNGEVMANAFTVEFEKGVYLLKHEQLSEEPFFAKAYYDKRKGLAFLYAKSEEGYTKMREVLVAHGFAFLPDPDIRVHTVALAVIDKLLKRTITIDPYEEMFQPVETPESKAEMEKLNHFLRLALPFVNSNQPVNVEKLALEAGIDPQSAEEILTVTTERINRLKNKK